MTQHHRRSPGMKTFKTRPQQEAPGRGADPGGRNVQPVKGKLWQSIKQQVTIGECGDHRGWDSCTHIYPGNFDAFNACSPSEKRAAGIAYISHSSLPVWVFGLDSRKLFETSPRHFKHFCLLNIQFVYSADAFFPLNSFLI